MAESVSHKGLAWGVAQPPATNARPPDLGEAPWRALAGRERALWRSHWQGLIFVLGSLAGLMLWLQTMYGILIAAQVMFKEYNGDCPLPAMTQISLAHALFWDHTVGPWAWPALAAGMALVIWHWQRRRAQLRTDGEWRRFCLAMSLAGTEPGHRPDLAAQISARVRLPAIKARVTAWLTAGGGTGAFDVAQAPGEAGLPAPLSHLLSQPVGGPTAKQWAATGELLESHMVQQSRPSPLSYLAVYWALILGVCLTGFAWLGLFMPFIIIHGGFRSH